MDESGLSLILAAANYIQGAVSVEVDEERAFRVTDRYRRLRIPDRPFIRPEVHTHFLPTSRDKGETMTVPKPAQHLIVIIRARRCARFRSA